MKLPKWVLAIATVLWVGFIGFTIVACERQVSSAEVVMTYEGCKVVKTKDGDVPVYLSICDDRSAVSWKDDAGKVHHTISERK
jgi:hypothetical protein